MHKLCLSYNGNVLCGKVCEQSADRCTYCVCNMMHMYYAVNFVNRVLTDAPTMPVIDAYVLCGKVCEQSADRCTYYACYMMHMYYAIMFVNRVLTDVPTMPVI